MNDKTKELLPCPFCGSEVVIKSRDISDGSLTGWRKEYQIQCEECYITSTIAPIKQEVVNKWNTRHLSQIEQVSDEEILGYVRKLFSPYGLPSDIEIYVAGMKDYRDNYYTHHSQDKPVLSDEEIENSIKLGYDIAVRGVYGKLKNQWEVLLVQAGAKWYRDNYGIYRITENILHLFFNHKSDANNYLSAEQQEELEKDFINWYRTHHSQEGKPIDAEALCEKYLPNLFELEKFKPKEVELLKMAFEQGVRVARNHSQASKITGTIRDTSKARTDEDIAKNGVVTLDSQAPQLTEDKVNECDENTFVRIAKKFGGEKCASLLKIAFLPKK